MTEERIIERIKHIRSLIDPDIYPETANFLEAFRHPEHMHITSLVNALADCDRTKAMLPELFDFLVELYEEVISLYDNDIYIKASAMHDLGALYYDGRGVNQDFTKAVHYYEMALEHGSHEVLENLGYCYYYGRLGYPDYEKAFHCFARLAFEGDVNALYKIGDMYRNGYYVKKDLDEAFRIYSHCEDFIGHDAKYAAGPVYLRLGKAYLYGEGTEKDLQVALKCFQRAENFLYEMVSAGDVMYRKSLQAAIDYQAKARSELMEKLSCYRTWPNE